jgi:hypothetical protein
MLIHDGWRGHRVTGGAPGFATNLPAAAGSSGSPVFCATTHALVGLYRAALIRPGTSLLDRLVHQPCWAERGEVSLLSADSMSLGGTPSTTDPAP